MMGGPMFRAEGFGRLSDDLHRMRVNLTNADPAFRGIAEVLADVQRRHFDTEGASSGPKWAALDPSYRARKAQEYPGRGTLHRTGKLRSEAAPGSAQGFSVYRVTSDSAEIGISPQAVPYAADIHHGRGDSPARPLIGTPTRRDNESIADVVARHILKGTAHARR